MIIYDTKANIIPLRIQSTQLCFLSCFINIQGFEPAFTMFEAAMIVGQAISAPATDRVETHQ